MDLSVHRSHGMCAKTSGRHISLSAHREPARAQAFVVNSPVIESIAEEHDTSSQSHSASRRTGFTFHCTMTLRSNTPDCPLRNRRALSPGFRIKKPLIWTHTRPTTNNPIHTCCFYLCWLLCFYLFITLYFTASAPSPFHSCSHTFIMSPPARTFTLPGRLIPPALHSTLTDEVRLWKR